MLVTGAHQLSSTADTIQDTSSSAGQVGRRLQSDEVRWRSLLDPGQMTGHHSPCVMAVLHQLANSHFEARPTWAYILLAAIASVLPLSCGHAIPPSCTIDGSNESRPASCVI